MEELYVFYQNKKVGVLRKNKDATLSFLYDQAWALDKNSFALSPTLNLDFKGEFDNRKTRAFFENLIPEGNVKERLEKLTGKSVASDYQFLKEYGVDCAGAFVISPIEEFANAVIETEFSPLDLKELSQAHKENRNLMIHVMKHHKGRFSLAGAQDKISIVYKNGEVYIPTKGGATTHILKPPHLSGQVKDSVFNEYFCMKLAKACGLLVPHVDVIESDVPFYITERYDRQIISGEVARLHQFDFCQAQDYLVDEKYEQDGGPTLKNNFDCIQNYSAQGIDDAKRFLNWISFNILIGNNDSHSKNLAFLVKRGSTVLAPFYDLLCTSIYKEYSAQFAFSIGKLHAWGKWQPEHLGIEVSSWGLDKTPQLLSNSLSAMKTQMQAVLDEEVKLFRNRFPANKVAGRVAAEVQKRLQSFDRRGL